MVLNIFFPGSQQVWWSHSHISLKAEGVTSPDIVFSLQHEFLRAVVFRLTFRGYASMFLYN